MVVDVVLVLLAVPVLGWTGYLAGLALLSMGAVRAPVVERPRTRFCLVVPAHNEEIGIAATVENLLAVDYPEELRRIVVVADNCSDHTAEKARAAGATVLDRTDTSKRGKGYALAFAFELALARGDVDALVVVDADTKVTDNLLRAFDARLQDGAQAVQAEYAVSNPEASWRTRLMHIAFTLFHDVRSRARERLHLSAGLRGNGMAFSAALLGAVPHDAFSIVEDVEYGIRIGLAGHRVQYAGEAKVYGEMVSSEAASRSQRRRWEGGRWALAVRHAPTLVAQALGQGSPMLMDLAADLLVPPLTYVAFATGAGAIAAVAWHRIGGAPAWVLAPWVAGLFCLLIYIARGLWLARMGPRVVLYLLWAPVYMVWKVALALGTRRAGAGDKARAGGAQEWVRTAREGEKR
jgi:GT2 family glycosyltransferase